MNKVGKGGEDMACVNHLQIMTNWHNSQPGADLDMGDMGREAAWGTRKKLTRDICTICFLLVICTSCESRISCPVCERATLLPAGRFRLTHRRRRGEGGLKSQTVQNNHLIYTPPRWIGLVLTPAHFCRVLLFFSWWSGGHKQTLPFQLPLPPAERQGAQSCFPSVTMTK